MDTHDNGKTDMAMAASPLTFDELGHSCSQSVLFMHGGNSCRLEWRGIAERLAERYHLLIVDAPGHGDSVSAAPWSLQRSVDLHADLIRTKALDGKAHLVGFSMGGYTALQLARQHSELVHTLFLSGVYDLRTAWGWKLHFAPLQNIPFSLVSKSVHIGVMRRMGMTSMNGELYDAMKKAGNAMGGNFSDIPNMRLPPASAANAWQMATPCLLVAADKNDNVTTSRALAAELAIGNAKSHLTVLSGAVHWWGLQYPALFSKLVEKWLRGETIAAEIDPLRATAASA